LLNHLETFFFELGSQRDSRLLFSSDYLVGRKQIINFYIPLLFPKKL
jgi:hypothetical protein